MIEEAMRVDRKGMILDPHRALAGRLRAAACDQDDTPPLSLEHEVVECLDSLRVTPDSPLVMNEE
jgi:hypothetical protein